eukprot:symbB.v1.2.002952.t1/scaffold164.1/size290097/6
MPAISLRIRGMLQTRVLAGAVLQFRMPAASVCEATTWGWNPTRLEADLLPKMRGGVKVRKGAHERNLKVSRHPGGPCWELDPQRCQSQQHLAVHQLPGKSLRERVNESPLKKNVSF